MISFIKPLFITVCCIVTALSLSGATYEWTSAADFPEVMALKPGDTVLIKAGDYVDVETRFTGGGNRAEPAVVRAEEPGTVRFYGAVQFEIAGNYIVLEGLVFDGRPENFDASPKQFLEDDVGPHFDERSLGGPAGKDGVIIFNENSADNRLTNCFFSNFDHPYGRSSQGYNYITMRGFRNEVDHCSFEHKRSLNSVIFIKPDPGKEPGPEVRREHRLHHNYFGERNYVGKNGWEVIRVSDSGKQAYEIAATVDHNYFYKAIYNPGSLSKEKEIISNKSRKNRYMNNVFDTCDGQITLRHGRDCLVENNWFLGKGSTGASGVRVIGTGHVIRGNVFDDIDGIEFAATFTTMRGGYGVVDNQYEGVEDIVIEENVFLNCAQPWNMAFANGRGEVYDFPPRNLSVRGNKVLSNEITYPMFIFTEDLTSTGSWEGNEYFNTASGEHYGDVPTVGWVKNSSLVIELGEPPVTRAEVGPSYYDSIITAAAAARAPCCGTL